MPGASSYFVVSSCAVRAMETEFCNEYFKAQETQRYADGTSTCRSVLGGGGVKLKYRQDRSPLLPR